MHFSIDRTVHTTAFDKPVVGHWLERKIAQTAAGPTEKDRSDDRPLQRRARYRLSYIPLPKHNKAKCEYTEGAKEIQRISLNNFTWVHLYSTRNISVTVPLHVIGLPVVERGGWCVCVCVCVCVWGVLVLPPEAKYSKITKEN